MTKVIIKKKRRNVKMILKEQGSFLTTNEAIKMVKEIGETRITLKTLLTWLVKYKMGRKIGGRWIVYRNLFNKFLTEGSKDVQTQPNRKANR